jgi:hypothetical protein
MEEGRMTDDEYRKKLDELDCLLNDPDVPMQAGLIWRRLGEIAGRDCVTVPIPRSAATDDDPFGATNLRRNRN